MPHYSSIGTLTALPASHSMPSLLLSVPTTAANVAIAPPLEYSFPVAVPRMGVDGTQERPKSGIDLMSFARPNSRSATRPPSLSRLSSYTNSTATSAVTPTGEVHGEIVSSVEIIAPGLRETVDARTGEGNLHIPHSKTKATFSLPAVAVHTAPVTTHASREGDGRSKRFSLVLGGKSRIVEEAKDKAPRERSSLDQGTAVGRLAELLGRKRS
jgi:hypothetical protein